ncbi:hypothetical protein ABZ819_05160 [Streptomyces venezuelae]|uniref:DUF6907 domain-containing protein n=1 Tax=Streptomyces venezuelae TaxID=54571 RepID=UPI003442F683
MATAYPTGALARPDLHLDAPVPYSVTDAGARALAAPRVKPGYRLVPARVGRPGEQVTVHVECPTDWCIADHVAEPVGAAEDINHQGTPAVLNLASDQTVSVPTAVYLSWWPGSHDVAAQPCLAVDVDREVAVYGRTGALAIADQIAAFAADVRRLAETLPGDELGPSEVAS